MQTIKALIKLNTTEFNTIISMQDSLYRIVDFGTVFNYIYEFTFLTSIDTKHFPTSDNLSS